MFIVPPQRRPRLGCAALLRYMLLGHDSLSHARGHRAGLVEANEHLVRRVLQTSVGLMQLTGRLGSKLAELVAVRYVGQSPINQIGTHEK
jgi:hypothetical protein